MLLVEPAHVETWARALEAAGLCVRSAQGQEDLSAWLEGGDSSLLVASLVRVRAEDGLDGGLARRPTRAPLLLVGPEACASAFRDALRLGAIGMCAAPPDAARLRELLAQARARGDRAQAVAARAELHRYLGYLSHRLRTPVTSLSSALTILEEAGAETRGTTTEHFLEVGRRNVQRLSETIERIEELVALENGEVALRPAPSSLPDVADRLRRWMARLRREELAHLELDVRPHSGGMLCDGPRLAQLLAQFLGVATGMADARRPTVATLQLVPGSDGTALLRCCAHGIGAGAAQGMTVPEASGDRTEARDRLLRYEVSDRLVRAFNARLRWEHGPADSAVILELPVLALRPAAPAPR